MFLKTFAFLQTRIKLLTLFTYFDILTLTSLNGIKSNKMLRCCYE